MLNPSIPFILQSGQCPCPVTGLLPLILLAVAGLVLWRGAQWVGGRIAARSGQAGRARLWSGLIFAIMAVAALFVLGSGILGPKAVAVNLEPASRPRLIFLGAKRCLPCQQMEPVREFLRTHHDEDLIIEFYDVEQDPETGHRFGIRSIPTTIFIARDGKELHREVGYLSEDDIMNKWRELGFAPDKGQEDAE